MIAFVKFFLSHVQFFLSTKPDRHHCLCHRCSVVHWFILVGQPCMLLALPIPTLCYTITLLKYVFFHSECIIMSSAHMIQHLSEYSKHSVHLPCCKRQSDPPSIITRRQCLCSPETQQDLADVAIYTTVYWLQLSLLHTKTRDLRLCHL